MTRPTFSIVLPVYNAATTLPDTIASVLAQTEQDFELIAIDDGSSDDSLKVLLDIAARDERIRIISQANKGVSATRNFAISLSNGRLIAFLDADDRWQETKLEAHRALHESEPEADASYARIAFVNPDATAGANQTTSSIAPGRLTLQRVLEENPVCTMSNLVVRKSLFDRIGCFDEAMSFAEDQEWLARAAHRGAVIRGIDALLVDYRLSLLGLSVNLDRMYEGWRLIAGRYGCLAELKSAEAIYCRYLSRRALRAGAPARVALHYARRGLQLDASAFLADRKRGGLTLISAIAACFVPPRARQLIFS